MADQNLFPRLSLIKTVALAAVLALASPAPAAELQLVPLEKYLSQYAHIGNDPAAMGYVAKRCASWYSAFSKSAEGETNPTAQQALQTANAGAVKFFEFATRLEADWYALSERMGSRRGLVRRIQSSLSDPHQGLRSVKALEFDSGQRLVYKPKNI